jgi:hypothetical protein
MVAFAALTAFTTTSAPAATDLTGDLASATSPIEVIGSPVPSASANSSEPTAISEDVAFEDRASVAATAVDFTWFFVDANGAVIAEEQTSTRGRFTPNVPERNAAAAAHLTGYTSGESLYIGDEGTNDYVPVDHVAVMVDNATFASSAWHAGTRESNALPPQLLSDSSARSAHIRITRIRVDRASNRYDRVDTLLSFANDNQKRINAIQFTYSFYDLNGNLIFLQPAVVRAAYAHGAISTLNSSSRVRSKGVVMNRGSVWMGWGDRAEYVSKIVVGVGAIQYSDGTTRSANT